MTVKFVGSLVMPDVADQKAFDQMIGYEAKVRIQGSDSEVDNPKTREETFNEFLVKLVNRTHAQVKRYILEQEMASSITVTVDQPAA